MLIVGMMGEPATGKTTVMRAVMRLLGGCSPVMQNGLVRFHACPSGVLVLGEYSAHRYSGTDRLSMAVQPQVIEWLSSKPARVVLWEGDRLTNSTFLKACEEQAVCSWHVLRASDERLAERRRKRGSQQNQQWLRGRQTKLHRISAQHTVTEHDTETAEPGEVAQVLVQALAQ